jgi:hypothetical protein
MYHQEGIGVFRLMYPKDDVPRAALSLFRLGLVELLCKCWIDWPPWVRTSPLESKGAKVRNRRTAAARLQAETLLERPVFGVERPLSKARRIRGSRGGDVSIERRRRDAKAMRDLRHAYIGVGQHRLGSFDVVLGQFRRTPSRAASAPRGGEACLGALADQAALEFR